MVQKNVIVNITLCDTQTMQTCVLSMEEWTQCNMWQIYREVSVIKHSTCFKAYILEVILGNVCTLFIYLFIFYLL